MGQRARPRVPRTHQSTARLHGRAATYPFGDGEIGDGRTTHQASSHRIRNTPITRAAQEHLTHPSARGRFVADESVVARFRNRESRCGSQGDSANHDDSAGTMN